MEWFAQHAIPIKSNWIRACRSEINNSENEEYILTRFLQDPLEKSCNPVLPTNIQSFDRKKLGGLYVLEVVETVNIGESIEKRKEDTNLRMLKFCLTDGYQQVIAIEYMKTSHLNFLIPNTKIAVRDVEIRHGILLLTPINCLVLGSVPPPAVSTGATNISYLSQNYKKDGKYNIQGWIRSTSHFEFANDYVLQVIIEDGTLCLKVDVASKLVEKMMTISCSEFRRMYELDAAQVKHFADQMQCTLQTFEGILQIEILDRKPILVELSHELPIEYFLQKLK